MAENESLDLSDPYARRWDAVKDAVRKGQSCEEVSKLVRRALYRGLRSFLKQLAKKGITLQTLLANRDSPAPLRRLLKQSEGHDYVELFAQTALTKNGSTTCELLEAFVSNIWDTISDQIAQQAAPSERWSNFADMHDFLNEVQIDADVRRIAQKLDKNPSWMPTCKPDRTGSKADPTAEMLVMSLLPIRNK
jgi:hypothetical protein